MTTPAITTDSPFEQLLGLLPKLVQGNGALSSITELLPHGLLSTVLNSPYGGALVDIINSQTGNRALNYDDLLMTLFPIPKWAWTGTGVLKVVSMAHDLVGMELPQSVVALVITTQYNIYGSFPAKSDIAPSAIFVAINSILMLAHFYIFARGYLRNHYFWPSFGLGWQCIFNILGFGMRIGWAKNLLDIRQGIASTIFIVLSIVLINLMNLLLAHRVLTYRHPETGDATWFGWFMILVYLAIGGVLLLAVISEIVIFSYFLDYNHWRQATGAMQAAAILITLISVGGIGIIGVAYSLPRGALSLQYSDRRRLPASNIESYGIFYFPPKFSQVLQYKADPSAKMDSGKLAARVVNGRDLATSASIIVVTSLILAATAGMRAATTMIGDRYDPKGKPVFSPALFYVGFGVFETITNVIFLLARVDLRFYIPDWPRKGHGPIVINPDTMEYKDPYAPNSGQYDAKDEKFTSHIEEANYPAPNYDPAFMLSPKVAAAAQAMRHTSVPFAPPAPPAPAPTKVNPHTAFSESTTLPQDSKFADSISFSPPGPGLVEEPPRLYQPEMVPPPRLYPLEKQLTPPRQPPLTHSPPRHSPDRHSPRSSPPRSPIRYSPPPTLPSLVHERHDAAPVLPEMFPTPFPSTPYNIRTTTPPVFATPNVILPPATPQHFPEPPMDSGFTPVLPGLYDHYRRPYEEPQDEFRHSRNSED